MYFTFLSRSHDVRLASLFVCAIAMSGCSNNEQSPLVEKFSSSELHALGNGCKGDYFAVRNGNFVRISDSGEDILQKEVEITDAGSHRLQMAAAFGSLKWITTFRLENEDHVAVIENARLDPEPTAEQWKNIAGGEMKLKAGFKQLEDTPHMVLCPAATTKA